MKEQIEKIGKNEIRINYQLGWNYLKCVSKQFKTKELFIYNEELKEYKGCKLVVRIYEEYINGELCGPYKDYRVYSTGKYKLIFDSKL